MPGISVAQVHSIEYHRRTGRPAGTSRLCEGFSTSSQISDAPDPDDGYFEVWLRDDEVSQLISLGAVTQDSTTLQVPAGIDLSEYPVVDVSHEHFDGDPGHSGVTLAAGPMDTEED